MKYLAIAAMIGALSFVGPVGGQAQTDPDPYAPKINSFIAGYRDTYEHVRTWQSLNDSERLSAERGVLNALSRRPDPVGDLHPESVHPCSQEPSERLRDVCNHFERETQRTAQRKAYDPEYVRGQIAMLRMINNCQAPGIVCFGTITVPFGR